MPNDRALDLIHRLALDRCVSRQMMLDAGLTIPDTKALRRQRHLVSVFPGTYVVGHPVLSHREFLRASVIHSGPASFVSGRSGLELRRILPTEAGFASVTTLRRNVDTPVRTQIPLIGRGTGELTVSQSTPTSFVPVETVDGFETTLLPRTLIDTAADHGETILRRAWKEAEFLCQLDPAAIDAEVNNGSRRAGSPLVRARLRDAYPVTRPGMDVRSRRGEVKFLEIVREAGLPAPLVNVWIRIDGRSYLVDFYWASLNFVVEIDGPHHDLRENAEQDKVRDVDFFNHGIDVLRFTTERLRLERDWCVGSLRRAYERQLLRIA